MQIKPISTEELFVNLDNPECIVVDVRPIEAYNGWKLNHERRGGHIKNARSLPSKWSKYIDWIEIVRAKGILPKHTVVVYGYDNSETEKVAQQFFKIGYPNVRVYHNFIDEWSSNDELPMDKMKRYHQLVSADWLNELIATGSAPEYTNKKCVICHAHYQNRSAYEKGHIPGAIDLDTNLLESSETWNRRSPEELKKTFENLGITYDTTVILYGRFSYPDTNDPFPGSSAGHLGAMRCAFIMMYAGVEDVRILNGGLQSWIDSGFETTTKEYKKQRVKDFGIPIPSHPEIAVDIKEAQDILKAPDKNLVSVRSWREYIGEVSGYHYIEKKGRIPGAVFGNCGSDAYHMENYRNLDHTTREYHEIETMWKEVGITPDKHNSFYCGTGWRGSEAFVNAWLMGWSNISVFDGGWFEWSKNGYPYETGIPSNMHKQIMNDNNSSDQVHEDR
jgi:3-mercaptopyruvate sulfurtransferase SseA